MISFEQALAHVRAIEPLSVTTCAVHEALGLISGQTVQARVSCPSLDSSLRDGFAVLAADTTTACLEHPVALSVQGTLAAGDPYREAALDSGQALRIMTGASIPAPATAVLPFEVVEEAGNRIIVRKPADPGHNILPEGTDIRTGQKIVDPGERLSPAHLGLLAAAGIEALLCHPRPRVAVVATGSELVWPGRSMRPGQLIASNLMTAAAALRELGIEPRLLLLKDDFAELSREITSLVGQVDLLITCGGILDGDRDLTLRALREAGLQMVFSRVRINPGKGVCMGRIGRTVVFALPGGPPSNHVALRLFALSAARRLMGFPYPLPEQVRVIVRQELQGKAGWNRLIHCRISQKNGCLQAVPLTRYGRLEALAKANGLLEIPESGNPIKADETALAWLFGCCIFSKRIEATARLSD